MSNLFSGKNKNIINLSSAECAQIVVKVNVFFAFKGVIYLRIYLPGVIFVFFIYYYFTNGKTDFLFLL